MKLFVLLLSLVSTISFASESMYALAPGSELETPYYGQVQSFGFQGTVAVGLSAYFSSWYSGSIGVGYSPSSVTGQDIFNGFLQNRFLFLPDYAISENIVMSPYLGLSMIFGTSDDLFYQLPEQYSPSYYPPTALRMTLDFGLSMTLGERYSGLLQWSLLDSEVPPLVFHSEGFKPINQYGSVLLGLRYRL